jgi:hypothetical protein
MRFRVTVSLLCALIAAAVLSACGSGASDNGESAKSADTIVADSLSALSTVSSVHMSGSAASGSTPVTLDLTLVPGKGGKGQVSESGLSFQLIVVNNAVYINGSKAFLEHFGGQAAAQLFDGKWLKAPQTGQLASVVQLTDLQSVVNQVKTSHGTLAKGSTTTVKGQKAIEITDTTKGGSLFVSTTGKPYPVEISKSGSGGGQIYFDHFNQSVTLSAPANAIDLSKFPGAGG